MSSPNFRQCFFAPKPGKQTVPEIVIPENTASIERKPKKSALKPPNLSALLQSPPPSSSTSEGVTSGAPPTLTVPSGQPVRRRSVDFRDNLETEITSSIPAQSDVVDPAGDSSSSSEDEAGEEEGGVGLEKGVAKLTTGRVLPKTPPMKRK